MDLDALIVALRTNALFETDWQVRHRYYQWKRKKMVKNFQTSLTVEVYCNPFCLNANLNECSTLKVCARVFHKYDTSA